jgi:hypothetical protein
LPTILFDKADIGRFNAEYEAQQQDITSIKYARRICGIYAEKSEAGRIADGKRHMELITGVLR